MLRIEEPSKLTQTATQILAEYPRFFLESPESLTDRTLNFISANIHPIYLREAYFSPEIVHTYLFEQLQNVKVSEMGKSNKIDKMRGVALARLLPAAKLLPATRAEWFGLCAAIVKQNIPYTMSDRRRFRFFVVGLQDVIEHTDKVLWDTTIVTLNKLLQHKWAPIAIVPIVTNRLNALDYVLSCMQEDDLRENIVDFECYVVPRVAPVPV